jgi:hypothetical protein
LLFGAYKLSAVWGSIGAKCDSLGALREGIVFDVKGDRSGSIASELAGIISLEGKL